MDPTAAIFVPVHALNAPPRPRFERYYDEFKFGVARMQDLSAMMTEDEEVDISAYAEEYTQFKQLSIRLLKLGKFLTAYIEQSFAAAEFESDDRWFGNALNECMLLCHKYSWATILLVKFIERKEASLAMRLGAVFLERAEGDL